MRNNQPVSGREYPFPQGKTVISYTNLKGQITRANDAFIDLSGFTKAELMDQPHNLVRHPDMPSEAFRDMWDTLKKGRQSGIQFFERSLNFRYSKVDVRRHGRLSRLNGRSREAAFR